MSVSDHEGAPSPPGLVALNDSVQVTSFTPLHDQVEGARLSVDNSIVVAHNVLVSKIPKKVHLLTEKLLLFFIHHSVVNLLPNK